ncbi:hypothetical protein DL93DRAFT_1198508 [Clavulina sp. PMI_390]|nr:hypothetical protein DL93DRAFT_1198508 [Clavulina sp. PMI_390]
MSGSESGKFIVVFKEHATKEQIDKYADEVSTTDYYRSPLFFYALGLPRHIDSPLSRVYQADKSVTNTTIL